nr:hypothetical protein [Acidiphilium sp. 20-67-58]
MRPGRGQLVAVRGEPFEAAGLVVDVERGDAGAFAGRDPDQDESVIAVQSADRGGIGRGGKVTARAARRLVVAYGENGAAGGGEVERGVQRGH